MFVRTKKRKLKNDTALDVMLLESVWIVTKKASKHRFLKQWTIRKSDIWSIGDSWLSDVAWDLSNCCDNATAKKILSSVRKKMRQLEKTVVR